MEIELFAYKDRNGSYIVEHLITNLEKEYDRLEYGDVAEGEYQIWKYPSGKIYQITPDRVVSKENYYASPYSTRGVVWLPKLKYIRTDQELVKKEYERLKNLPEEPPLWKRLLRR